MNSPHKSIRETSLTLNNSNPKIYKNNIKSKFTTTNSYTSKINSLRIKLQKKNLSEEKKNKLQLIFKPKLNKNSINHQKSLSTRITYLNDLKCSTNKSFQEKIKKINERPKSTSSNVSQKNKNNVSNNNYHNNQRARTPINIQINKQDSTHSITNKNNNASSPRKKLMSSFSNKSDIRSSKSKSCNTSFNINNLSNNNSYIIKAQLNNTLQNSRKNKNKNKNTIKLTLPINKIYSGKGKGYSVKQPKFNYFKPNTNFINNNINNHSNQCNPINNVNCVSNKTEVIYTLVSNSNSNIHTINKSFDNKNNIGEGNEREQNNKKSININNNINISINNINNSIRNVNKEESSSSFQNQYGTGEKSKKRIENVPSQNEIKKEEKLVLEKPSDNVIRKYIKSIHDITKTGQAGDEKKVNQDNYFIFNNFNNNIDYKYLGVCDGHGYYGREVSQYIKENLPSDLNHILNVKKLNILTDDLTEEIKKCFLTENESLLRNQLIDSSLSGSTCVSVIYTPDKLIIANIGDSRCVIGREENGKWTHENLSRDHKPTLKEESERILKRGGKIRPMIDDDGSFIGPLRVYRKENDIPGLAMTRSFGDYYASCAGTISEPEVTEYKFKEGDRFLIIASDGLFEFINSQSVVEIAKEYYAEGNIVDCCEYLYKESFDRWIKEEEDTIDDITIIVLFFS